MVKEHWFKKNLVKKNVSHIYNLPLPWAKESCGFGAYLKICPAKQWKAPEIVKSSGEIIKHVLPSPDQTNMFIYTKPGKKILKVAQFLRN